MIDTATFEVAKPYAGCLYGGMEIGGRIEESRRRKGWSQAGLGSAIGIPQGRVSRWERNDGMPTLPQILAISQATGVSLDYLLTGVDPEPVPQLAPDEAAILDLFRALRLSKDEGLRALAWAARQALPEMTGDARPIRMRDMNPPQVATPVQAVAATSKTPSGAK